MFDALAPRPRSRVEPTDVTCPSCGQIFRIEVWLTIDRAERPDLVHRLMDGQLSVAVCPHCGVEGGINHPLLLHDGIRQEVLCAVPLSVKGADAARTLVADLLQGLVEAIEPAERQPYLGEVELVPELDGLRALLIEQSLAADSAIEDRLIAVALEDLLNAGDQQTFQQVMAEHRQLLLEPRADDALATLLKEARASGDRLLQRRVREARAILGRMRTIVATRRQTLADLLDTLAPLSPEEAAVVPELKHMLDALDPQEVYAARIRLDGARQEILDALVQRLREEAATQHQDVLAFLDQLQALPRQ
jgi:hypothetical protein